MKKTISLLICLLLCLSLATAFSGCSKTTIVGTWTTTLDCTDRVKQILMDGSEYMEQYFSFPTVYVKLNVEFSDDNTCAFRLDENELNNALSSLDEPLRSGIKQFVNNMGMDAATLESNGGLQAAMDVFYEKNALSTLLNDFNLDGTYKLEENTLYFSDQPTTLPDGSFHASVELSKTELVLKDANLEFETVKLLADAINGGLRFSRVES